MPTTLQQAPPAIAFSKNRIRVQIKTDNVRTGTPVKAVNKLQLSGMAIVENDLIILSWKIGSATFKAVPTPDDSGLQIPTGNAGAAHAQAMLVIIKSNYFINRDFDVTLDTTGANPAFIFTAKSTGIAYIINTTSTNRYAITNPTPGIDGSLLPGFMHYLQVLIGDSAGVEWMPSIYNYNVPLDDETSGITTLDLADILQSYLKHDVPDLNTTWQLCTRSMLRYKLVYAAFYGSPAFVRMVKESATYYVAMGGYSNLALQRIGDNPSYLQQYLMAADSLYKYQRWLETWPIDNIEVKTNQPQFLYFINNRSIAETYKIKIELTFADGTSQLIYKAGGTLLTYQKVCITCGYTQLGLQAYVVAGNLISSYKITLVEAASLEQRSLVKSFNVNRDYEEYTRYFIYADSAGTFKTLRTTGTSQISAEIKADLVGHETDRLRSAQRGAYQNTNILAVHSDKLNTGYITSAKRHDALIEICMAKRTYRVAGGLMIPIVITNKNFEYSSDGKFLNASQLEYRLAYDDELYTGDSEALAIPQLNQSQQSINDI